MATSRIHQSGFFSNSLLMREVCPMLIPLDRQGTAYDGVITVCGQEFRLKLQLPPNSRKLENVRLDGDLNLKAILKSSEDIVCQRLRSSKNLPTFLRELQTIIESQLMKSNVQSPLSRPPKYFKKVIEDIELIGWQKLSYLDEALSEIHFTVGDKQAGRMHNVIFKLSDEFPGAAPQVVVDLPAQLDFHWSKGKGLHDVYDHFQQELSRYQAFWDILDELDRQMWVMEPEHPRRCDVIRRISLGKGSSLLLTFNPLCPRESPSWQLFGNDQVVNPLQERLSENIEKWDSEKSVAENLIHLLGSEIPSRENTKKEDIQGDCGVCYTYNLDGNIPDKICENFRCKKEFHSVCLYEWLQSLPDCRQSFNIVFGECPYCSKGIQCKAPNT